MPSPKDKDRFNKRKTQILVVDDDSVFRKSIGEYLSKLGFGFKVAADGKNAVEKLRTDYFSIVFTDIKMPNMDGIQLIAHVKQHYPETDVLVTTGYNELYNFTDVIKAGAIDYITKPFSLKEFEAKLNRAIRERDLFNHLKQEIEERKKAEKALQRSHKELEQRVHERTDEILETNTALRVMLKRRDQENAELAEDVRCDIMKRITPCLKKIRQGPLTERQKYYIELIETNLAAITPSNTNGLLVKYTSLTSTELKVANLVKQRKSSKEIADFLDVSIGTIKTHRENIRKKLRITNKKENLYRTLLSLP